MLDLSYLTGGTRRAGADVAPAGADDLDDAYARYVAGVREQGPDAVPMPEAEFERYSLGSNWLAGQLTNRLAGLRDVAKKVVQTCRLVVGIHDYEYYLNHMRSVHPNATPLTREAFYRYCLEARFPSADRPGGRCPC